MFTEAQIQFMKRMAEVRAVNQANLPCGAWEEDFISNLCWKELAEEVRFGRTLRRIRMVVSQPLDLLAFTTL